MGDIECRIHQVLLPILPSDLTCQVGVRSLSAADLSNLQLDGSESMDEVVVLI